MLSGPAGRERAGILLFPFPAGDGHGLPHLQLISPSPAGPDRRGALGEKPQEMVVVSRAASQTSHGPAPPGPETHRGVWVERDLEMSTRPVPSPAPLPSSAHHPKDDALDVPAPLWLSPHARLRAEPISRSGLFWGVSNTSGCRSPLSGLLSFGVCVEWNHSVFLEEMAAPWTGNHYLTQPGNQNNHLREKRVGAELTGVGWACRITAGFAVMLFQTSLCPQPPHLTNVLVFQRTVTFPTVTHGWLPHLPPG